MKLKINNKQNKLNQNNNSKENLNPASATKVVSATTVANNSQKTQSKGIVPTILILDSLLKVHRLIDLNSVEFHQGKQCEELPSCVFKQDIYHQLLTAKVKFRVESDVNPDENNLALACIQHDFGKIKWYTPKYFLEHDGHVFDVKLVMSDNPKKVRYMNATLTELKNVLDSGEWTLLQLAGGRLSKKQEERLNVKLVSGKNFAFYQKT